MPNRGSVVSVEKVADQMYRLVDHGRPLELGLFNSTDSASGYCKQRGWRPETMSIVTHTPTVKKNLPKSRSLALDLD